MGKSMIFAIAFGIVFLAASSSSQAALVGSWSFNSSDGEKAADNSGNSHDGKIVGPVEYTKGIAGEALVFDGEQTYVDLGSENADSPLSLQKTSYTITFWVKLGKSEGVQRIINKDSAEDFEGGYSFYSDEGLLKISTNDGASHNANVATLPVGSWRFIGLVFDLPSGTRTIYVDGDIVAAEKISDTGLTSRSGDPLWFGAIPKYDQSLTGALDEVRIYDEALTGTQISELIENPEKDGKQ
jgi:hypothetical protein